MKRAEALGVQSRGGDRGNQYQSGNPKNFGMAPSAKEHADALGVRKREDNLKQNTTNPTNVGTVPSQEEHADAFPN